MSLKNKFLYGVAPTVEKTNDVCKTALCLLGQADLTYLWPQIAEEVKKLSKTFVTNYDMKVVGIHRYSNNFLLALSLKHLV